MRLARTRLALFLAVGSLCLAPVSRATPDPETLASADFEDDVPGAQARPGGPPTVAEQVYESSDTTQGSAGVATWSGGKRFRVSDLTAPLGTRRGIRVPFSRTASAGTLAVSAVVTAEQGEDGGWLCVQDPDDPNDWLGMSGFNSGGTFTVHGQATNAGYAVGDRYLVEVTLVFGPVGHVDYRITDLDSNTVVYDGTGFALSAAAQAGALTFRTDAEDAGAFTVDDVLVTN